MPTTTPSHTPGYLQIRNVDPEAFNDFRAEATRQRTTQADLFKDMWETYKLVQRNMRSEERKELLERSAAAA